MLTTEQKIKDYANERSSQHNNSSRPFGKIWLCSLTDDCM